MEKYTRIPVHSLGNYETPQQNINQRNQPVLHRAKAAFESTDYKTHQPHRHDYFEVFVTAQNGGLIESNGIKGEVASRSIVVLPPGVVHRWCESFELDGFIARIPIQDGCRHFRKPGANLLQLKNRPTHRHILGLLEWIAEDETNEDPELARQQWRLFYRALANEVAANKSLNPSEEISDLCANFLVLLERKYHLRWGVQDYAHTLGVSRSTLLRCMQEHLDCSPADLIHNRTFREAERLLITTSSTCAEISEQLGFLSQAQFTRAFTSKYEEPPTQYRAKFIGYAAKEKHAAANCQRH